MNLFYLIIALISDMTNPLAAIKGFYVNPKKGFKEILMQDSMISRKIIESVMIDRYPDWCKDLNC